MHLNHFKCISFTNTKKSTFYLLKKGLGKRKGLGQCVGLGSI